MAKSMEITGRVEETWVLHMGVAVAGGLLNADGSL